MMGAGKLRSYITHALGQRKAGICSFADLSIQDAQPNPSTVRIYEDIRFTLKLQQLATLPQTRFNDPEIELVKSKMAFKIHDMFYGELRKDLVELEYALERAGVGYMLPELTKQLHEIITKTEAGNLDEFIRASTDD